MTRSEVLALAASFILVLAFVPIVGRVALRLGLTDRPGHLKIHSHPTPRIGGVAFFFAFLFAIWLARGSDLLSAWPFPLAAAVVCAAGFTDDIAGASAGLRLGVQFFAGALLWIGGWNVPLTGTGALNFIATCVFIVALVNSLNFLDGSDGIAAGVAAMLAAGYVLLPGGSLSNLALVSAWALLGVCVAFLAYNFPPAASFMGDSGSTLLGFLIAFLALDFWRSRADAHPALVFPFVLAGFPLLDAALAILRRLLLGASPLHGDRRHTYDLLLARRWSARRVALACYAINLAFVVSASLIVFIPSPKSLWPAALVSTAFLLLAVSLGSLGWPHPRPSASRVEP